MQEIMLDIEGSCCFTGHRSDKLPWGQDEDDPRCCSLKCRIDDTLESLYDSGVRHFICGMARGSDMFFAEAVLALRASRPGVTLEAAVPCRGQDGKWPRWDRERYRSLLAACDSVTLVSEEYTPWCMQKRNEYMVDRSDVVVAVFNGERGGTANTLKYARKRGRKIIVLAP